MKSVNQSVKKSTYSNFDILLGFRVSLYMFVTHLLVQALHKHFALSIRLCICLRCTIILWLRYLPRAIEGFAEDGVVGFDQFPGYIF